MVGWSSPSTRRQSTRRASKATIASSSRPASLSVVARLFRAPSVSGWSSPSTRPVVDEEGFEGDDRLFYPAGVAQCRRQVVAGPECVRAVFAEHAAAVDEEGFEGDDRLF